MSLLARVVRPPSLEVQGNDQHPKEKYVSVDENGFLQLSPDSTGFDQAEGVVKVATFVWDTDLMQWVRATASGATSGGTVTAAATIKRYDIQGSVIYIGDAQPGSSSASPAWRIRRISMDSSGNPETSLLAGVGAANQVWDNRASLSYT
jgi:hypothetical protein